MSVPRLMLEKPHKEGTVEPNFKKLFEVVTTAVADAAIIGTVGTVTGTVAAGFIGAVGAGIKGLLKIPSAFEPKELSDGMKAYLLVHGGLVRAIHQLMENYASAMIEEGLRHVDMEFQFDLPDWVEKNSIELDGRFVQRPSDTELIQHFQSDFISLLVNLQMPEVTAKSVTDRLPEFYAVGIMDEWFAHPTLYGDLEKYIDHPLVGQVRKETDWLRYRARLLQTVKESVLGEPFGLKDVYVWPRGVWEERVEKDEERQDRNEKKIGHVLNVYEELSEWVLSWSADGAGVTTGRNYAPIKVLSGEPGVGKSSFVRMFAARLMDEYPMVDEKGRFAPEIKVLFINLFDFDLPGRLREAVGEYASEEGFFHNPLGQDDGDDRLLIIFDGLDELHKGGAAGKVRDFVEYLTTHSTNTSGHRVKFLLSGRIPIIQEHASRFREPAQLIEILPYWDNEWKRLVDTERWKDPKNLLKGKKAKQQHDFWKKLAPFKCKTAAELAGELDHTALHDLVRRPLLNALVTLTHCGDPLDCSAPGFNRNSIYAKLLRRVHERDYEKRRSPTTETVDYEDFTALLELVGELAWHAGERGAKRADVHKRCTVKPDRKLQKVLNQIESGRVGTSSGLMVSFFFRRTGHDDGAVIFTHKTFGEYLAALRLVRRLDSIFNELADEGERETLEQLARLLGPQRITSTIEEFLINELELRRKTGQHDDSKWQRALQDLIEHAVQNEVPVMKLEYPDPERAYRDAHAHAVHTLESLFLLHSLVVEPSGESTPVVIEWEAGWKQVLERDNESAWFMRQLNTRLLTHVMSSGSLVGESNTIHRFIQLNLSGAVLTGAVLTGANLTGANLTGANLTGANLTGANLTGANLTGANLTGANLREADLIRANLREANLEGAVLTGANLTGAVLTGANLTGANLIRANLREANLEGAVLTGANLTGANLTGANLTGANLREADLIRANLREANLEGAVLTGAKLEGATLRGVKVLKSDIESHWDLTEEELKERGVQIIDD